MRFWSFWRFKCCRRLWI